MGNARVRFRHGRDIAVVAARVLAGGEYIGKTYELNGPEAVTYTEVAEKISKHAGRTAQYVNIAAGAQRKAMLDQGMPAWPVDALLDLQGYYTSGKGGPVDSLLQNLLRHPPITMDRFLAEYAGQLQRQTAIAG